MYKKRKKRLYTAAVLLLLLSLLAACGAKSGVTSTEGESSKAVDGKKEPVTLKIYDALFKEDEFNSFIVQPVKKMFPHITLERTTISKPGAEIPDLDTMLLGGSMVDILLLPVFFQHELENRKIPLNLAGLVTKTKTDLSKIDPAIVSGLSANSQVGEMNAFPVYKNIMATFYNKDLFDKFGVSYPKDGITWKEATELARKTTRMVDGQPYYGLFVSLDLGQLSINVLDKKTNKSTMTTEPRFKKAFQLQQELYAIPGMKYGMNHSELFLKQKNLAMWVQWIAGNVQSAASASDLNWDIVTMPVYEDRPGVHSKLDFHASFISKSSKYQDDAFDVISMLATNTEIQSAMSRAGRITVLQDSAINNMFGSNFMKGKNLKVLELTKMAPIPPQHPLENKWDIVGANRSKALEKVVKDGVDLNTALRDVSEVIDKLVEAEMKK